MCIAENKEETTDICEDQSVVGFSNQMKMGNLDIVLHHATHEDGSILNCPSLPGLPVACPPDESLATHYVAFHATDDNNNYDEFPSRSLFWSVASTKHAISRFRFNPDGFCMNGKVTSGCRVVVFARLRDPKKIADYKTFNGLSLDKIPEPQDYIMEAIPILPGTEM